ncbi:MAG: hypothetical protein WBG58_04400 [Ignavibacteriaceae bacterium]
MYDIEGSNVSDKCLKLNAFGLITHTRAINVAKDIPSSKYPFIDSIITCGVTVLARAICRINKTTIKSKKKMLARFETVIKIFRLSNFESHPIKITTIAILKTFARSLLKASAENKKINVKQTWYKIRCHSIGKNGRINIVNTTSSNKIELLVVKNLFDMFEKIPIYFYYLILKNFSLNFYLLI